MSREKQSYCIILPVTDETISLKKTIEIILKNNKKYIKEIIIVSSKIVTTKAALKVIISEKLMHKNIIKHHIQQKPFIGGAIEEGFNLSSSTHTIMMASDLETDPYDISKMISISLLNPNAIITANRWLKGGKFKGYNFIKLILNYVFQFILKLLYGFKNGDFTYGYRLYPTKYIKNIGWKENKHPFLLETLLIYIVKDYQVIEIPSSWSSRSEGVSQNTFFQNFNYLKTAIRIRFFNRSY